jgi:nitrogenase-stabilizing/protective protein
MPKTLADFHGIVNAEDYFEFFELPYDPKIVNVNRLHILQKFSQFMQTINPDTTADEAEILNQYRVALQNAYNLFITSSPLEQKLFKVFQNKPQNVVMLSDISIE